MALPALIDTHCHLNYDYSPKTVDDLVLEANEAGVTHLMTIGTEMANLEEVKLISEKYDCVYHSIGVHPHEASTIQDSDFAELEKRARHPKCRAIGEIGLDTHYNHSPLDIQIRRLDQQLELAAHVKLPVVIHSREAETELLDALRRYTKTIHHPIPGIIHCFSGTEHFAQECLALGFYISFSGILTFKNAIELQRIAKLIPLDRILVETDSPYLSPVPMRGKKCEPAYVRHTALKLAEIHGLSFENLAAKTTENAKKVLQLH